MSDDQGLDFTQQETSEAGVVTGSYSVALPDGRIQTVKYSVGPDTGYVVSQVIVRVRITFDQIKYLSHMGVIHYFFLGLYL